jgi:hypothetical protein
MHPYSWNSKTAKVARYGLIAPAILSIWPLLLLPMEMPNWVFGPIALLFYLLYYELFDRVLWRVSVFRALRIVDVPDLNGVWEASLKSSFSHLQTEHRIFVRIRQTWTRISVTSEMPDAVSTSVAAAVRMTEKTVELIYTFDSRSKGKDGRVMQKHSGTAWLRLSPDRTQFAGQYFTGRGRNNVGSLRLRRARKASLPKYPRKTTPQHQDELVPAGK